MIIAMLLSGRIKSYQNLLKILEKSNDEIHLFISINDDYLKNNEFYDKLQKDFLKFLKNIQINDYILPSNFYNNNRHNIQNGMAYYRTLSCLYNDKRAFVMMKEYINNHNINYDYIIRFRGDIIADKIPEFNNFDKNILYCVIPYNDFTLAITANPNGEFKNGREHCYGNIKFNGLQCTNDIAIGNLSNMELYCNCYDYVLSKNIEYNGNYFICFEYSITTYLYENNINFEYFKYNYNYCNNRF